MGQSSFDEVVVVSLRTTGTQCMISLEDGDSRREFTLAFVDANGIPLLVGADDLTKWLMGRGKLWALQHIRELLESAIGGRIPSLPHRLRSPT